MVEVDKREGSYQLLPLLEKLGIPCTLTTLFYGDIAFLGNGPDETLVPVGVEVKTVEDVCSCVHGGRFAGHQLPGLLKSYVSVTLLIEGEYRCGNKGELELRIPRMDKWVQYRDWYYADFEAWLNTLTYKLGIHIRRTRDRRETAQQIAATYNWWTGKTWEEHRSHLVLDDQKWIKPRREVALLSKPTFLRRVINQIPGISFSKSLLLNNEFTTLPQLMEATPEDIASIKGFGKITAEKIYNTLRTEK
jgi:ERCC4-type nuclease